MLLFAALHLAEVDGLLINAADRQQRRRGFGGHPFGGGGRAGGGRAAAWAVGGAVLQGCGC